MLRQFLKDDTFLMRYYGAVVVILGLASLALGYLGNFFSTPYYGLLVVGLVPIVIGGISTILVAWLTYVAFAAVGTWGAFNPVVLLWIPVGALLGLYSAMFMHQCVHGLLRPRWLNRAIGELCALQQLIGFYVWGITHMLHHRYPDDPVRDAHPPGTLGYWAFGRDMKRTIIKCLDRNYFEAFGDSRRSRTIWRITKSLLMFSRVVRAFFLLLVFGPTLFIFLFLPSFVVQMMFYVHFNWATHRVDESGRVEICNLHAGVYYKFINTILFGGYYHKNHHVNPSLFDPRTLEDKDEPLVSYDPRASTQ